ncbi:MAG TPA: HAD hydrolase-like protein [Streptosporangiaceae bacterium]
MRRHLVLWDIDYTLIDAGGLSRNLYGTVFAEMFGRELLTVAPMAGRTDRAIITETLTGMGVEDPGRHVAAFMLGLTAAAPAFGERVRARGCALPGAAAALAAMSALADADGRPRDSGELAGRLIVQSVLTGNIRPLAEAKLGALDLTRYLDLDAGAYGDAHENRPELVHLARRAASEAYGADFGGEATVLIGDTPLDVAAALATGARAVAVATGGFTAAELAAAGPHVMLPDLTDTPQVITAILGHTE